jgi:hypothetical protein
MKNRKDPYIISPIAIGSAIGIALACFLLQGGYDAFFVFFTDKIQTVPAWVHLITRPIGWIPWPTSWAILSLLTVLTVIWAKREFGGRWWLGVFSAPVLWEIWSGQIELLVIIGLIIALRVLDKRLPPIWLGVAVLLILSKPWVGWALVLLIIWFSIRDFGIRKLLPAAWVALGIIVITLFIWPNWLISLYETSRNFVLDDTNGALFPWGLLSWVFVIGARNRLELTRRVTAASILSSPYLRLYHSSVLIVLDDDISTFVVGWGILGTSLLGLPWQQFAWVLPLFCLIKDKYYARHDLNQQSRIPIPTDSNQSG